MKRILTVVALVAGIVAVIVNAPAILAWIGGILLSVVGWIAGAVLSLVAAILTPIMPVLIVIGGWAAVFGFFGWVTSGPKTPETTEDKILKELKKLNRRNNW